MKSTALLLAFFAIILFSTQSRAARPSILDVSISKNKLELEFMWNSSPNYPEGYALEIEVRICPKCFVKPAWDIFHIGKDYVSYGPYARIDPYLKTYMDPFNYAKPETAEATWDYVINSCGDNMLLLKAGGIIIDSLFYNKFKVDPMGNFAIGIYDASKLMANILYKISIPVVPSETSCKNAYAWVTTQLSPRSCVFQTPFGWDTVKDCPYFIGGGITSSPLYYIDCGVNSEEPWATDICVPIQEYELLSYENLSPVCTEAKDSCSYSDYPDCSICEDEPPAPSCFDGVKNQDEVKADCGGVCVGLSGYCPHGPMADGWYCGDQSLGQDPAKLYYCVDGEYSQVQSCGTAGCKKNTICTNDQCNPLQCTPNSYKSCSGGQLYWYNSCDQKGSLANSCGGCGCSGSSCLTCPTTSERIYVVNMDLDAVMVVDPSSASQLSTIPVGNGPRSLAQIASTQLVVANSLSDNLSIIDTDSLSVIDTIPIACDSPLGLAVDSSSTVLAACSNDDTYVRISLATGQILNSVSIKNPSASWPPMGVNLFSELSEGVGVIHTAIEFINLANFTVIKSITLLDGLKQVDFDSSRNMLLATNSLEKTITRISTSTRSVSGTWSNFDGRPFGIAYDESLDVVYLSDAELHVDKLNASTGAKLDSVLVGKAPQQMMIDHNENVLWVANFQDPSLSKVDLSTFNEATKVLLTGSPEAFILVE